MKNRLAAVLLAFALLVLGNGFRISAADTAEKDAGEAKTVYVLTDTLKDGNEYLILNRSNKGSGKALDHNQESISNSSVTVLEGSADTNNQPYIEAESVSSTAVWTATKKSAMWKLSNTEKGKQYCLGRANNSQSTLSVRTDDAYNTWSWDGTNNYLSMEIGGSRFYLYYASRNFALTDSTVKVYIYEKTELTTADPSMPTSVVVEPETLDLEVGDKAQLTATVYPETATDRTVRWESADESIATVDKNGVVTALHDGTIAIRAIANGDGTVNVTDVSAVISHILGRTPDGFNATAADVNADDVINVTDVSAIINIILGK